MIEQTKAGIESHHESDSSIMASTISTSSDEYILFRTKTATPNKITFRMMIMVMKSRGKPESEGAAIF